LTLGIRLALFLVDFFALVDCFIAILTASIIYFGPGFCILRAECLVEPRSLGNRAAQSNRKMGAVYLPTDPKTDSPTEGSQISNSG
jgi:hypothetical protein